MAWHSTGCSRRRQRAGTSPTTCRSRSGGSCTTLSARDFFCTARMRAGSMCSGRGRTTMPMERRSTPSSRATTRSGRSTSRPCGAERFATATSTGPCTCGAAPATSSRSAPTRPLPTRGAMARSTCYLPPRSAGPGRAGNSSVTQPSRLARGWRSRRKTSRSAPRRSSMGPATRRLGWCSVMR